MTADKNKMHYGWIIVICCCIISFSTLGIGANCMTVFLSGANAGTGINMVKLSLYYTFMTFTMAIFQPVARIIFDKFNAKIVVAIFAVLPGIGTALMALYSKPYQFWLSGIINGIGLSLITFLLVPTLLNKWFVTKIGFVMGLCMAFSNIGGAVWAPVAGKLVVACGWRMTNLIMGILIVVISCPVALICVRRDPEEKGLKPYGAETVELNKAENKQVFEDFGLTLKKALTTPWIYMIFIITIGMYFIANFQPQVTQYAISVGFPIDRGAFVSSMLMIGSIVGKVGLGALNDKAGLGVTVTAGVACGVIGIVLLVGTGGTVALVFVGAFLYGIAYSLMTLSIPLFVRTALGPKYFASIYSIVASVGSVTSAIAAPVYAAVYESTNSYTGSLLICLSFMIINVALTWIIVAGSKKLWKNTRTCQEG